MAQNTSHAVMAQRSEPHDSLDDFPTQPWATRALCEHVLFRKGKPEWNKSCPDTILYRHSFLDDLVAPKGGVAPPTFPIDGLRVWEPACNRGHMAKPLREYFGRVFTSDIHDYSAEYAGQERVVDFLFPFSESSCIEAQGVHWIITNPPFRLAEQFIERALSIATVGVAMIVRTSFLEGVGRYENLFTKTPPNIIAQFAERVPMVKGRLTATGSTATAYCWLVWMAGATGSRFVWIPPCRKQLERREDYL